MNQAKISCLILFALTLISGCKKNPVSRLVDPLSGGAVPQSSGVFRIYDNELLTGGGLGLIPGGENQAIDLSDASDPRFGLRQILYRWNGGDVHDGNLNTSSHTFAGFSLLVSQDFNSFENTPARNLSSYGYTKLTLYIRGNLSDNTSLRIEGPGTGATTFTPARTTLSRSELTNSWQKITLTVPSGDFASVKSFITISLQYDQPPRTTNHGDGGTVYLAAIQYEQ